jgi:hypothetical protein
LELEDVSLVPPSDTAAVIGDELQALWQKELRRRGKPNLFGACLRLFYREYFILVLLGILSNTACKLVKKMF